MGDIWHNIAQWLMNAFTAVMAFLNWYIDETPLFKDTLDSLYAAFVSTMQYLIPQIGEYIQYITGYIGGVW